MVAKLNDKTAKFRGCSLNFVSVLSQKMAIITLSESLLLKLPPKEGLILRDRILCGLCIKVGRRTRTFFIATSVAGEQIRITLGRWPLLSVEEARTIAAPILKNCRAGQAPLKILPPKPPTLDEAVVRYTGTKRLKAASLKRYLSIIRTHFPEWQHGSVTALKTPAFAEHCHAFAQTKGAALVEVGRGLIGALIKYLNAVHSLDIENPFDKLAAAGLMPDRAQPRVRKLQEADIPLWKKVVDTFFHEAGHILLHGKKDIFLEGNGLSSEKENEADEFASAHLIPSAAYREFTRYGKVTLPAVDSFARKIGIAPGIVVGRLDQQKQYHEGTRRSVPSGILAS